MDNFKNKFFSPKDFLGQISLTHSKQYQKYQFLNRWGDIVGKAIYRHTKLVAFKNDILYVQVNDPMWKNELTLNKQTLIKKINTLFPVTELKEIIFSYRPFKTAEKQSATTVSTPTTYIDFTLANEITKKELEKEYNALPIAIPQELRESLAKLKLTWSKVQKNPPPDVFPHSTDPVDSIKSYSSNLQFVNYYFPLNSIRSEFLDFTSK